MTNVLEADVGRMSAGEAGFVDHASQTAVSTHFARLRTRAEFVATARGERRHTGPLVLQSRARPDESGPPRFGLTISKKAAARAVDRNRIRRRLREALRLGAAGAALPGHDYVIVARSTAVGTRFLALSASITQALAAPPRKPKPHKSSQNAPIQDRLSPQ